MSKIDEILSPYLIEISSITSVITKGHAYEAIKIALTAYTEFLLKNGDCDVYAEEPTAVDRFIMSNKSNQQNEKATDKLIELMNLSGLPDDAGLALNFCAYKKASKTEDCISRRHHYNAQKSSTRFSRLYATLAGSLGICFSGRCG